MRAQRTTKVKKLLDLIGAVLDDTGTMCSPHELSRRLHRGQWEGRVGQALDNLKRRGYLEIVEINNAKAIKLTQKGQLKTLLPIRRKKQEWDGRWRLVAFDIEEERHRARDIFRTQLGLLGFKMFQKSLWITPYDISEEIEKLIDILNINDNVDYFVADAITDEGHLIHLFKLDKYEKKID